MIVSIKRFNICYSIDMPRFSHITGVPKAIRAFWLLLCASFVFASVAMPVYSAQTMLQNVSMFQTVLVDKKDMQGALHHGATSQQHHVEDESSSPCADPGCSSMSDCSDSCAMNTCCSSPSASNADSNRVLPDYLGEAHHRLTDGFAVLSPRSDPLFRPPIL